MGDDSRLESWKEIAAYLRRDVRTVQRWEQSDGLPIHRHKRPHRSIPYAYKSELDAWWTSRSNVAASDGNHVDSNSPEHNLSRRRSDGWPRRYLAGVAAAVLVSVAAYGLGRGLRRGDGAYASESIAVLPFLDLSEGMKNEEFADGITEELIDRLNKIPGVHSPAPASVFYFKNKHVPVGDVGKALGVAYVLDGSVRKAGERVRVAARLIRADTADVVWSDSYERPWNDILVVQDDIAGQLTRALTASLQAARGATAPS